MKLGSQALKELRRQAHLRELSRAPVQGCQVGMTDFLTFKRNRIFKMSSIWPCSGLVCHPSDLDDILEIRKIMFQGQPGEESR
jgi:hypothetical protein